MILVLYFFSAVVQFHFKNLWFLFSYSIVQYFFSFLECITHVVLV